jgi:hypothetical protein
LRRNSITGSAEAFPYISSLGSFNSQPHVTDIEGPSWKRGSPYGPSFKALQVVALPEPIDTIHLRSWPADFPEDVDVGPPWSKDHRMALAATVVPFTMAD